MNDLSFSQLTFSCKRFELFALQGEDSGDELDNEYIYADRTKEKLVWVDALNKWVPQKQVMCRMYI